MAVRDHRHRAITLWATTVTNDHQLSPSLPQGHLREVDWVHQDLAGNTD